MSDKKTIIVTGGSSGLGFECAVDLAENLDHRIILACRNRKKAEHAKQAVIKTTGNPCIESMELDVSSLSSVRAFARQYQKLSRPLYGLVLNAGVNGMNSGLTSDGFDVVFETNHLGHFLLVNLLIPVMEPSGRIAAVSSDMHCPPGAALDWPGTRALAYPDKLLNDSTVRYSYSKLCNLYFVYELSRRLTAKGSSITANALNPGLMTDTNFAPDKSRFTADFLEKVNDRLGSLKESSKVLSDIITNPDLASTTGKYFDRGNGPQRSSLLSYDLKNALELWEESAAFADLTETI